MQLETVRTWQLVRMDLGLRTVHAMVTNAPAGMLTRWRDGGTGWTAVQVLGHLHDFEDIFWQRAVLTVNADNPPLPFPDPDELAAERDYNLIDWRLLFEGWRQKRDQHMAFLKARTEEDWERPAIHPKRGRFTLHDQLFLTTLHDGIHLEQLARILAEKQEG